MGRDDGAGKADAEPPPQDQRSLQEAAAQTGPMLDPEHFLPYRLSLLVGAMNRVLSRLYEREYGLSVGEWRLLAVLARFGPLSANGVGDRAAMDKVRVSRAVARAITSGLIDRTIDPYDRRRSVLSLTGKGRALHERITPLARTREREFLSVLTETELRSFSELANRLLLQAIRMDGEGSLPPER